MQFFLQDVYQSCNVENLSCATCHLNSALLRRAE